MTKKKKKITKIPGLSRDGIMINGNYFHVENFPEDQRFLTPKMMRRGTAYLIDTDMTKLVLPYRGEITKTEPLTKDSEPGIYLKKSGGSYVVRIVRPRKKERDQYRPSNIKDYVIAALSNEFALDQFILPKNRVTEKGESFLPPLYEDDDPLNALMKTSIRMKDAPFDIYGDRLEAYAIDHSNSVEGSNTKNNVKRMLRVNRSMSSSKFMMCAEVWDMNVAIILMDSPNAVDPIFTGKDKGKALIYFPRGTAFTIDPDKLVDATPYIERGIQDTKIITDRERESYKKEKEEN